MILGSLIAIISLKHLLMIPLIIGVLVAIQGIWGYVKR